MHTPPPCIQIHLHTYTHPRRVAVTWLWTSPNQSLFLAVLPSDPLTDPGHDDLVPVVVLQEDGVPSTDTWALWNGSFPDLSSMALCMWVQASYWRLSGTVFSYAVDDLIDNGIMLS